MDCLVTFTRTNFCASLSYFKKEIMKKGNIFEPHDIFYIFYQILEHAKDLLIYLLLYTITGKEKFSWLHNFFGRITFAKTRTSII